MAWMHWCMILTFQLWGKTRASTTFWIDVSSSHRTCPLTVSVTLLCCYLPCGPCVFRPSYMPVFGSLNLSRLEHNRCLLLSVPNKEAFINGQWPTWSISWCFPFHSLIRWRNPPKMLYVLVKKPDNLIDQIKSLVLWALCLDCTSFSDSSWGIFWAKTFLTYNITYTVFRHII